MKRFLPTLCFLIAISIPRMAHAQFSVNGPEMICAGASATLSAVGCAGTLQWSTGATTSSITVTPLVATLYSATCTESGGSAKKVNHPVGVFPQPTLTASTTNLCANENVTLRTNSTEFTHKDILWKRDGQPIVAGGGAYVANQAGTYTVEDGVTPGVWVPYPSAPAGGVYRAFSFTDDNNGWAISGRQDLIKTEDGGKNWVKPAYTLNLAPGDSLTDVAFTNAATGWTCAGGKIFKTSDGGANWTSQYADSTLFLNDLFFLDSQRGWAAGRFGVYGSEFQYESTVLRTTDGGTTWQRANPLPGNAIFTGVQFISAAVGWGISNAFDPYNGFPYDGTLMKSTDGGATWNPQIKNYFSGPLSCVYFQDANNGWLAGSSFLAKTIDGGNTWSYSSQIDGPFSSNIASPCAINFVGAVGWILDLYFAYYTTNSGLSWVTVPYNSNKFYPATAAFLPSGKILTANRTGSSIKFLPKTQSCLSSVTILPAPPAPKVTLSAAAALCEGEPITLTASGCVGTLSWSTGSAAASITVTPSTTTSYTVFCAGASGCSSTAYAGVAVLPKATLDTNSAAPCFRPVLTVGNVWSGMDMRWTKDGQLLDYRDTKPYLPSSAGTYAVGVDATGAWKPQAVTRSNTYQEPGYPIDHLKDIQFVNDSTGFIVGEGGQFLRTSNRGRNWIAFKLPVRGIYDDYNLYFVDAMHGWVAGSFETIGFIDDMLITSDGGLSWTRVPVLQEGNPTFLRDIHFINPSVGWATGFTGKIINSTDGGLTWQTQVEDLSQHFKSIFFLDNQTGWAGGENGAFYTTTDGGANWTSAYHCQCARILSPSSSLDALRVAGRLPPMHDNGLYRYH